MSPSRMRAPSGPDVRAVLAEAFKTGERLRIQYDSLAKGLVEREIRPYEVEGDTLWASDTIHGAGRIHRFYLSRIRQITPVRGTTFTPRWEVRGFQGSPSRGGPSTVQRVRALRAGLRKP